MPKLLEGGPPESEALKLAHLQLHLLYDCGVLPAASRVPFRRQGAESCVPNPHFSTCQLPQQAIERLSDLEAVQATKTSSSGCSWSPGGLERARGRVSVFMQAFGFVRLL